MNDDVKVIWKKSDGEMPEKAKQIVEAAQHIASARYHAGYQPPSMTNVAPVAY